MSLIHDTIKINYIREGYLPNYPYHMISDAEMCDAFLNETSEDYFHANYPLVSTTFQSQYDALVSAIRRELDMMKRSTDASPTLPDWIYSYMLGAVIGIRSDPIDIHDMLVLMNLDNLDDEWNDGVFAACYRISSIWLKRSAVSSAACKCCAHDRPPTIFGEPHVIKSLRLQAVDPRKV